MNNLKKAFTIIISLAITLFTFCSCSKTPADDIDVYLITKGSNSSFWSAVRAGAESAANEYGVTLTVLEPSDESAEAEQTAFFEKVLKDLPDAVAISAIDYDSSGAFVDKLAAAGVKVVEFDSLTASSSAHARVTIDNFASGEKAFNAVRQGVSGKLNICALLPSVSTGNARDREDGLNNAAREDGNAEITVAKYIESDIVSATKAAEEVLSLHPEINAVVALNEWATLAAGEAVRNFDLTDKVFVSGFDNNVLSVERLESGAVDSLVLQNPYAMGYFSVKNAYLLSVGKLKPGNSTVIDTVVATRENMYSDEIVKLLFPFSSFESNLKAA